MLNLKSNWVGQHMRSLTMPKSLLGFVKEMNVSSRAHKASAVYLLVS
jgi:hypothetical protein